MDESEEAEGLLVFADTVVLVAGNAAMHLGNRRDRRRHLLRRGAALHHRGAGHDGLGRSGDREQAGNRGRLDASGL